MDVCRSYGKLSHWAKECHSKSEKSAQAHVEEEDEGGLLLAEVVEFKNFPSPHAAEVKWAPSMVTARYGAVDLVVEHVFA
jgi:hypothetical protein